MGWARQMRAAHEYGVVTLGDSPFRVNLHADPHRRPVKAFNSAGQSLSPSSAVVWSRPHKRQRTAFGLGLVWIHGVSSLAVTRAVAVAVPYPPPTDMLKLGGWSRVPSGPPFVFCDRRSQVFWPLTAWSQTKHRQQQQQRRMFGQLDRDPLDAMRRLRCPLFRPFYPSISQCKDRRADTNTQKGRRGT